MGTHLYVGNLPNGANEAILRMAFGQNGRKVTRVHIVVDEGTGRSKGFGYVDMASESDAQAAILALDGSDLDGRSLKVNEACERPRRAAGSGRSGLNRGHDGNR